MVPIVPAATVMILRESEGTLEVLLLKRNKTLTFAPNVWVFPGGRVDPTDGSLERTDLLDTAKHAAVRECKEETDLEITSPSLSHFCKWTTPAGGKRRFETFFFHAVLEGTVQTVQIDDSEIVEHKWLTPMAALKEFHAKKINLLPPTFITLERIKGCLTYEAVKNEFDRTGVVIAEPVTTFIDGKFYSLYKGDSGYDTNDISIGKKLHRLEMDFTSGKYEFHYKNTKYPAVHGEVTLLPM